MSLLSTLILAVLSIAISVVLGTLLYKLLVLQVSYRIKVLSDCYHIQKQEGLLGDWRYVSTHTTFTIAKAECLKLDSDRKPEKEKVFYPHQLKK